MQPFYTRRQSCKRAYASIQTHTPKRAHHTLTCTHDVLLYIYNKQGDVTHKSSAFHTINWVCSLTHLDVCPKTHTHTITPYRFVIVVGFVAFILFLPREARNKYQQQQRQQQQTNAEMELLQHKFRWGQLFTCYNAVDVDAGTGWWDVGGGGDDGDLVCWWNDD